MQISRHWRLHSQRYRLEGVRYEDGQTSLQARRRTKESEPIGNSEAEVSAEPTPQASEVFQVLTQAMAGEAAD